MIENNEKPHFEHDCDHCVFLGHYENADLYICPGNTVLARFSSDGPDYESGFCAIPHYPRLQEAARRAVAKGYSVTRDHWKFKWIPNL
jgi:hypothetical protein